MSKTLFVKRERIFLLHKKGTNVHSDNIQATCFINRDNFLICVGVREGKEELTGLLPIFISQLIK
jgi:hypothetical protein